MILPTVLVLAAAYLLGAIPFGYILVWLSHGQDVRAVGSGSTGATNVLRAGRQVGGASSPCCWTSARARSPWAWPAGSEPRR